MKRTQTDWRHEYLATPWEYDISNNNAHSTYDQFIQLRDTLIKSNKYYADKAGRSLIIWTNLDWTPTDTIEIREPNMVRQSFEPDGTYENTVLGKYVTWGVHESVNVLSCEINKDWRYKLQHKEQFDNIDSSITRIHSYILQHKTDDTTQQRAVFDWEWNTAWEMIRMTAFGYVECDLNEWDWLELKIQDQWGNDIDLSELQQSSNRWSVEYIDLAYNV